VEAEAWLAEAEVWSAEAWLAEAEVWSAEAET